MDPVKMYTDSASTLAIVHLSIEQHLQHTKHFNIWKNFISDHVDQGYITIHYIPSNDQCADTLIKALPLEKLKHFNELLYVHTWREVLNYITLGLC